MLPNTNTEHFCDTFRQGSVSDLKKNNVENRNPTKLGSTRTRVIYSFKKSLNRREVQTDDR